MKHVTDGRTKITDLGNGLVRIEMKDYRTEVPFEEIDPSLKQLLARAHPPELRRVAEPASIDGV